MSASEPAHEEAAVRGERSAALVNAARSMQARVSNILAAALMLLGSCVEISAPRGELRLRLRGRRRAHSRQKRGVALWRKHVALYGSDHQREPDTHRKGKRHSRRVDTDYQQNIRDVEEDAA